MRSAPRAQAAAHDARRAVESASGRLDSAGRVGDLASFAQLFGSGARLIGPDKRVDTVSSPDAIVVWLANVRGAGAGATVITLLRTSLDQCLDGGAVESGSYSIEARAGSDFHVIGSGPYGVRWRVDSAGLAAVQTMALGSEADGGAIRAVHCASLAVATYARRRLYVSLTSAPFATTAYSAPSEMHSLLVNRGWNLPHDEFVAPQIDTTRGSGTFGLSVDARLRLWRGLFVEGYAATGAVALQHGWNAPESSYVVQTFGAQDMGTLLSAEWHRLRLGAGPAFVHVNWQNYHDVYIPHPSRLWPGGYGYSPVYQKFSSTLTGMAMQAAYGCPITSHSFVELFARRRQGFRTTVPALVKYPAWQTNFDGYAFGLSLGAAWW